MVKRKTSRRLKAPVKRAVKRVASSGLSSYAFGNALGIVSAICLLFYAVMSWFSSFDASLIVAQYPLYFSLTDWTLLIGLIQTYVLGYIGGWIFVKVYQKSLRG